MPLQAKVLLKLQDIFQDLKNKTYRLVRGGGLEIVLLPLLLKNMRKYNYGDKDSQYR